MSRDKNRRLMLLGALVVGGGALAVIASGTMDENLVYFWTPTELEANEDRAEDVTVRLGGQVEPNSKIWDAESRHLRFVLTDATCEPGPEAQYAIVRTGDDCPEGHTASGAYCLLESESESEEAEEAVMTPVNIQMVEDCPPDYTASGSRIPVEFHGDLPEMFREGIGVVVEGSLGRDGVFQSDTLLVKHSNEYQEPAEGETNPDMLKSADTLESGS